MLQLEEIDQVQRIEELQNKLIPPGYNAVNTVAAENDFVENVDEIREAEG